MKAVGDALAHGFNPAAQFNPWTLAMESFGKHEVAVLGAGDFDIGGDLVFAQEGSPLGSSAPMASLRQVVKRPDSRRAARRMVCCAMAMRSRAKSSWELTGW